MRSEELGANFPLLYHMAEAGSWPGILRHGLLSTSALLDLYKVSGQGRSIIEDEHRMESVTVRAEGLSDAVVRDQKPLNIARLAGCLTDMTVAEWLNHLNRRVFFWTSENRLNRLLGAKPYRHLAHDVLIVDTRALVGRHGERVALAPYNTGATMPTAVQRGSETFRSIADYPYDIWLRKRPAWDAVVELAVDHSVPDIGELTVRVESRRGTELLGTI